MTVGELLEWARRQLFKGESAEIDALVLLKSVTGLSSANLFARRDQILETQQVVKFQKIIEERKNGTPVAYLTGYREFWTLNLKVNRHVLIPRPETELVVERALKMMTMYPVQTILDLGTGSGAIALSIAAEKPHCQVIGVDFSKQAIELAEENKRVAALSNVCFFTGSWYEPVLGSRFDMILSNPPYIDSLDPHLKQGDVRHEPEHALVSASQGLADLSHVVGNCRQFLNPEGWIMVEHGFNQGKQVRKILSAEELLEISTHRDLSGNERVSEGQFAT